MSRAPVVSPARDARPKLAALLGVLLALGAVGCTPKIGDACTTSTDCSTQGDRLCDTTQPDGYCTIFNCEPNTCPVDEAACVAFRSQLDPACGPADDGEWARFERSFCMKLCEDDGDCRSGYECVAPAQRGASVVDDDHSAHVCLVKLSSPGESTPTETPAACLPADGGTLPPPYQGGGGSGAGGAGGAGM